MQVSSRTPLLIAAAALVLAGCSGGSGGSSKTSPKGASGDAITIKGFAFAPKDLSVKAGQKITVTNEDSAVHTITAKDKSFDSKDLAKGKSFTFTAGKAGKYDFVCDIHQYMTGTLTVT